MKSIVAAVAPGMISTWRPTGPMIWRPLMPFDEQWLQQVLAKGHVHILHEQVPYNPLADRSRRSGDLQGSRDVLEAAPKIEPPRGKKRPVRGERSVVQSVHLSGALHRYRSKLE